MVFYSYMLAISAHYDYLRDDHSKKLYIQSLQQVYRARTVGLIQESLRDMGGTPSDDLLGAVLVLMCADPANWTELNDQKKSTFASPLRKTQLLELYGAQPFAFLHAKALIKMIELKGGYSQIETDVHSGLGLKGVIEL